MGVQIVWFKRDLRIDDHAPLFTAAQRGQIIPLLVVEPEYWANPDSSARQYHFMQETAQELHQNLNRMGGQLIIRVGDVCDVLNSLFERYDIDAIYAHLETHNFLTYQRDKRVRRWARDKAVSIYEMPQNGVIRGLKDRNGWAARWDRQMSSACYTAPQHIELPEDITSDEWPDAAHLGLADDPCTEAAMGGSAEAQRLLTGFLTDRGMNYRQQMSSPVTAFDSCSRLSPHLAWGSLSIKQAFQASEIRRQQLVHQSDADGFSHQMRKTFRASITSFQSRLHWHCHFMQKLEDQPSLEWQNAHSAYDDIRGFDQDRFDRWYKGMTGYPLIDAVMRCLHTGGWINFRMRAMVMSFASYHLWLDWRYTAPALARLFIDYEPGIHYSQAQMQSGTTGINTLRIYNPVKQSQEQDPEGEFIRRYVPELQHFPISFIHTPWLLEDRHTGYPSPIVDEAQARRNAAQIMHDIRKNRHHRAEADTIQNRHGSRKAGLKQIPTKSAKTAPSSDGQMDLFSS